MRILPRHLGLLLSSALLTGCIPYGAPPPGGGLTLASAPAPVDPLSRTPPVAQHGQLRVEGAKLLDAQGKPVVLRGQSFGWDNWWPQYYNADVVQWLRDDWCVDVVRSAMGIEPDGAYLANRPGSKRRMMAVVEAAIQLGVYVIIDWHAHDLHQDEAVPFFAEMAQRYGSQPHVLYEVFNEPEKDETWPQVKTYADAVIRAIRQYDPDNVVIVGSPEWSQRIDLVAADPLPYTNVMYSVHFYAATHGQWLRDRPQAAVDAGIPVFVSESSGSEASGQGRNDYAEWNAWIQFLDKNQISWVNWSVSDKDGETVSVLRPGAASKGGWTEGQLTESGYQVRRLLRSYCQ
jgi:endoglucanase